MLVTTYSRGTPVCEWRNRAASVSERVPAQRQARRKGGVRGEALDCRVYAFAALQALAAMGLSLDRECERIEMLAAKAGLQAPPRVSYSKWMQR
jgi:phage terminase large subunit GpA-like protein